MAQSRELNNIKEEKKAFELEYCTRKQAWQSKLEDSNKRHSPLLRIPAKLRNKIYAHALGGHEVCVHKAPTSGKVSFFRSGAHDVPRELSALPQVSRQVHSETASLVFGLHKFQLSAYTLAPLLAYLGSSRAKAIRVLVLGLHTGVMSQSVRVNVDSYELCTALQRMHDWGNLRRIVFANSGPTMSFRRCNDETARKIVAQVCSALHNNRSAHHIVVAFVAGQAKPVKHGW